MVAAIAPFGGGLASSGGICGSFPGALAAIGLVTGKKMPEDRDHKLIWRYSAKMLKRFDEITAGYGSPNCRDIAKVDWRDAEQVKIFRGDPASSRTECIKVVGETAASLYILMNELMTEISK